DVAGLQVLEVFLAERADRDRDLFEALRAASRGDRDRLQRVGARGGRRRVLRVVGGERGIGRSGGLGGLVPGGGRATRASGECTRDREAQDLALHGFPSTA